MLTGEANVIDFVCVRCSDLLLRTEGKGHLLTYDSFAIYCERCSGSIVAEEETLP